MTLDIDTALNSWATITPRRVCGLHGYWRKKSDLNFLRRGDMTADWLVNKNVQNFNLSRLIKM